MELPVWFEVGSFVALGIILAIDLLLVVKRPHEPSMKEAGLWVAFYVALALVFAGAMFYFTGPEYGGQFVAGWVTEYSLSIDNLFVFIIIMAKVLRTGKYQQEVLMVGIIIALVLRGIFIAWAPWSSNSSAGSSTSLAHSFSGRPGSKRRIPARMKRTSRTR